MEKVIESIDRTIRLQLKFTPRRKNLAIRTLVLIFCEIVSFAGLSRVRFCNIPSLSLVPFLSFPHVSPKSAPP